MKETETKTQNQPKKRNPLMTVLNTLINILIVVVLIVSILIAVMALTSKASGISTMFGYTIQPIQSDSMKGGSPDGYPSGDFEKGDLMIGKATDFDPNAEYELGDIVTFKTSDTDGSVMLIVHRIVDVVQNDGGTLIYQTQGDNRETSPVPDQMEVKDYLRASDIGSVYYTAGYEGTILKGWGIFLDFLQSQQGFFFVVLLPMIIFFMYEMIRVVLNAMSYKKAKADEEKDEAVKAAVAEALAEKNAGTPEGADTGSAPAGMTAEEMEQFRQFQEFQRMQKAQQAESEAAEASDETEPADEAEEAAGFEETEETEETETPEE